MHLGSVVGDCDVRTFETGSRPNGLATTGPTNSKQSAAVEASVFLTKSVLSGLKSAFDYLYLRKR